MTTLKIRYKTYITTSFVLSALLFLMSGCESPPPQPPPETAAETLPESTVQTNISDVAEIDLPEQDIPLPSPQEPILLEAIGIAFFDPNIVLQEITPDEESKFIEATGYGFPAPNATNALQKMLTATEAAQYRAMANLAEKHTGLDVHREAKTVDMAFAEETVSINLSGSLSGVSEIERNYNEQESMASITLRMMIAPPSLKETPEEATSRQRQQTETTARIHALVQIREEAAKLQLENDLPLEELLKDIQYTLAHWTTDTACEVKASLRISPVIPPPILNVNEEALTAENDS